MSPKYRIPCSYARTYITEQMRIPIAHYRIAMDISEWEDDLLLFLAQGLIGAINAVCSSGPRGVLRINDV